MYFFNYNPLLYGIQLSNSIIIKNEVFMADFFDYLNWRGDLSFKTVPFNKIDALILAHLTYSIFDRVVPESFTQKKTFAQVAKDFSNAPDYEDRINIGFLINKRTAELMFKCAESPRFKNVELCGFRNLFSEENVEQFAAVTYLIDGKPVIAFRGTDDTIVGWKEDFNIAWLEQIPAQKDALEYFDEAAAAFKDDFVLVGHSKGGNLVINTAVNCGKKLQNRIDEVYNFDGPGFGTDFFESEEYKAVEKKIHSFYPGFSVVGMIFHHPKTFEIVRSEGFAFWQHDAMNWQVMGNQFINEAEFTEESRIFYKAFNEWVDKLKPAQKKTFVETMFCILEASGAKTNSDIEKDALKATARMLAAYADLDRSRKNEMKKILNMFKDVITDDIPIFKPFVLLKNNLRIMS